MRRKAKQPIEERFGFPSTNHASQSKPVILDIGRWGSYRPCHVLKIRIRKMNVNCVFKSFCQPFVHHPAFVQQQRNVFILKRRYPVRVLPKEVHHTKLKSKNFVYDLVVNTDCVKRKPLPVILTSFVEGIGLKGELVKVRPHFARAKLLLPKLAVYASQENIEKYLQKDVGDKQQHSSPMAVKTARYLSQLIVPVTVNMDEAWTLEPWHVAASLRNLGVTAPAEAVTLPEQTIRGPDLRIQGKEFVAVVTINNLETARVRCRICHWTSDIMRQLPEETEYWNTPAEPLFPEDEELLKSLPKPKGPLPF